MTSERISDRIGAMGPDRDGQAAALNTGVPTVTLAERAAGFIAAGL